jgi:hypothetical protein
VLASVSFLTAVTFLLLSIFAKIASPYLGIMVYLVLPGVVVLGLLLIPLGMWRKSRRLRKDTAVEYPPWPRIDLNLPSVRNGAVIFLTGTILFVLASTVGTYQAYHYTESVSFCGKLCHTVMKPEYVTHQISPHAIVKCATCHTGPGAGWYARSKIRGVGRAYEVLFSNYPRPIPTPIPDLKPTEMECHQCHWPEMFFGGRRSIFHHYMYDETNTHWPVDMIIHTGGGDPGIDQTGGIHWYMNIGYTIEYIARDNERQDIPWVRATNKNTGKVTVYQDQNNPLSKAEIAAASPRTMNCIDCHNRPTHIFRTPDRAIDLAIFIGQIDPRLPNVKKTAVFAMAASYQSEDDAMRGIAARISQYYRNHHANLYREKQAEIRKVIEAVQSRFSQNVFPSMKVNWKTHPDNLGHLHYKGCFRCHLGRHRSESGELIPHDCKTCHRIVAQGSGKRAQTETTPAGIEFEHPVDIDGLWEQMACSDCHTGRDAPAAVQSSAQPPAAPANPKTP